MIEKLEEYPFLGGEEEEIMTWKDGIRRERIQRMLERMKEYEMIIKRKRRLEVEV